MNADELDDLASELFDSDLPNVVCASIGNGATFNASLTREHVETDEIVGIRSVLLAPAHELEGLRAGASIEIDGDNYIASVIEIRGRAMVGVILGR